VAIQPFSPIGKIPTRLTVEPVHVALRDLLAVTTGTDRPAVEDGQPVAHVTERYGAVIELSGRATSGDVEPVLVDETDLLLGVADVG
jgi:hypothetical protein